MKSFKCIGLSIAILLILGFSGCSSHNDVVPNEKLIENYQNKKQKLNNDERVIYIIRNDGFAGKGAKFFVECNDKRFRINAGEYIPCVTKSDINTISYGRIMPGLFFTPILEVEKTYASGYHTVDHSGEKEIFYLLKPDVSKKVLSKIDKELGKSYIGNENFKISSNINKSTQGNSHSISLFNPSLIYTITQQDLESNELVQNFNKKVDNTFLDLKKTKDIEKQNVLNSESLSDNVLNSESLSDRELREKASEVIISKMSEDELIRLYLSKTLMKLDDNPPTANENKKDAKIIIYRKKDNGNSQVGLWTDEQYLGSLMVETYLEFSTSQNELNIYTKYGKVQKITITLEKGKTYYIEADSEVGWSDIYTSLTVKSKEDFSLNETMNKVTIDNNKINKNYQDRINHALDIIKTQKWSQLTTER